MKRVFNFKCLFIIYMILYVGEMELKTICIVIEAIAIVVLVFVTAYYAHLTHKLVKFEEERIEEERKKRGW